MLFVGTLDNYKLDGKGRLSVPKKWCERLGKDFYTVLFTVKEANCLVLYPEDVFERLYNRMLEGSETQQYDTTSKLLTMAEEASLDAQGRFTVNQRLKEASGLSNDSSVIFIGHGETIEIWNTEERQKYLSTQDSKEGFLELMDKAKASNRASEK